MIMWSSKQSVEAFKCGINNDNFFKNWKQKYWPNNNKGQEDMQQWVVGESGNRQWPKKNESGVEEDGPYREKDE